MKLLHATRPVARAPKLYSILHKDFVYTPSHSTDIRITFARARAAMQLDADTKINKCEGQLTGTDNGGFYVFI
jgi:hypothetical protein